LIVTQRDMMRLLIERHGRDEAAVCKAYAAAERRGEVPRYRNKSGRTADEYALALWRDGEKKGWF
jgi:hypothetical protein